VADPSDVPGASPASDVDEVIIRIYQELKTLLARPDLDPSVRANLVQALADVSLVVHDLALDYEMLYDLGV
jgi:hypothetical protein